VALACVPFHSPAIGTSWECSLTQEGDHRQSCPADPSPSVSGHGFQGRSVDPTAAVSKHVGGQRGWATMACAVLVRWCGAVGAVLCVWCVPHVVVVGFPAMRPPICCTTLDSRLATSATPESSTRQPTALREPTFTSLEEQHRLGQASSCRHYSPRCARSRAMPRISPPPLLRCTILLHRPRLRAGSTACRSRSSLD
jgi:hypothetical protein